MVTLPVDVADKTVLEITVVGIKNPGTTSALNFNIMTMAANDPTNLLYAQAT
jgi:hypothetical protein